MSALAHPAVALGIGDVCRRLIGRRWLTLCCGAVVVACPLLAGLWHVGDHRAGASISAATPSSAGAARAPAPNATGPPGAPLLVFGLAVAAADPGRWVGGGRTVGRWTAVGRCSTSADRHRAVMIVGVVLLHLVDRQSAGTAGPRLGGRCPAGRRAAASDRLKGGGCSARWNGCSSSVSAGRTAAAATAVIAAKGIIRFPELTPTSAKVTRHRRADRILPGRQLRQLALHWPDRACALS